MLFGVCCVLIFFFKQKTAYEMRISDWSSDVCSSDLDDRITAHGKAISRLPLEPRLAHMLVRAGDRDLGWMAAEVAVLVTERGLGGNDSDLTQRIQRWRREKGKRAEASRALVRRWTGLVIRNSAHRGNDDTRDKGISFALVFSDRISIRHPA